MDDADDDDKEVLKPRSKTGKSSAPQAEKDRAALTKRDIVKSRIVSVEKCAELLNRDRNTVSNWVRKDGCPFVTKADRDLGIAWELDLSEVVKWLQDRAVRIAIEKHGVTGDGIPSGDVSKDRILYGKSIEQDLETAAMLRLVVPREYVIERVSRDYNEIKKRLMTLPAAIAGRMDASIQRVVREIAEDAVRKTISKLKVEPTVAVDDIQNTSEDED